MTREQITVELLRNCPAKATDDHINIAPEPPKHTPGPWRKNTSGGMTYIENFYGQSICRVVTSNSDACLLSVAPDLLAALEGCMKAIDRLCYKHDRDSIEQEWIGHANEAIRKAKGE